MIYILAGSEQAGERFYHATQIGMQFKTYELLVLEF